MKEVKIGCSSSYETYGKRLDTAIIQVPRNSKISGLFTSNKFPAAPVKVAKRNLTNLDKKKKTALFFYDRSVYWSFNSWSVNPFTWALL